MRTFGQSVRHVDAISLRRLSLYHNLLVIIVHTRTSPTRRVETHRNYCSFIRRLTSNAFNHSSACPAGCPPSWPPVARSKVSQRPAMQRKPSLHFALLCVASTKLRRPPTELQKGTLTLRLASSVAPTTPHHTRSDQTRPDQSRPDETAPMLLIVSTQIRRKRSLAGPFGRLSSCSGVPTYSCLVALSAASFVSRNTRGEVLCPVATPDVRRVVSESSQPLLADEEPTIATAELPPVEAFLQPCLVELCFCFALCYFVLLRF